MQGHFSLESLKQHSYNPQGGFSSVDGIYFSPNKNLAFS
jgi:hypothetical protein